ncbi:glycosyltransferase family 39 protein [Candidatus Woesearchaeota archaeon]|nr:glycosyltransferase family 39 protein [Candidatus Woesearchaeota archaeon]
MGINPKLEGLLVTLLYFTALYFWTLPIQKSPLPYGEVDAASHYAVAEFTLWQGRSITLLPHYIDVRYGDDNVYQNHVLWYPPPFHTGLALGGFFGAPNQGIYIANALFSTLIILSVYFLMRNLYGILIALLSSFFLMFSMRDILTFLWGQWPERMGFAFIPLVLWCLYAYYSSIKEKTPKSSYLYLIAVFLASALFIHPMAFFHALAAISVLSVFFLLREKRFFFSLRHIVFSSLVFLIIISVFPDQTLNVFATLKSERTDEPGKGDFSRLFRWFKAQENAGVPEEYFSYRAMIGPVWTIPIILIAVIFLLLRRSPKDLVMLAWLVSLYIMLHLDFIGKGRVHRSLSATAHLFYPLIVLGIWFLLNSIPVKGRLKAILKYGLLSLFAVFLALAVAPPAFTALSSSYQGVNRLNPSQYEIAQWLKSGEGMAMLPETSRIYHLGSVSLAKSRWLSMAGHHEFLFEPNKSPKDANASHVAVDTSDFALAGRQDLVQQLEALERQSFANQTSLYNKNGIRVYQVGS